MSTARTAARLAGLAGAALGVAFALAEDLGVGGAVGGAVIGAALGGIRDRPRVAWPLAVLALLALAPTGVSWGIAGLATAHAFGAARWDTRDAGLIALAALAGALELGVLLSHESVVPAVLFPAAAWGAGAALRERELTATALRERARELEEEREAHAALSVRYERARIASELHDIVAHAISVMVVQASAGQRLAARDPEATAEAFEAIAGAAREAEQDMQRLVALLGDETAVGPTPDLTLVDELVARAARSGLDVTLRLEVDRAGLPAAVVEAAYRVAQEGLTNALRYAAGAAVAVRIGSASGALDVEVLNAPAAIEAALVGAGTGSGITGLRERVSACGGTLTAGRTPSGGWSLRATFPDSRVRFQTPSPRVAGAGR